MEMEMELDFDFGFIGAPSNSIFVSETKMEMELDFQWTGGRGDDTGCIFFKIIKFYFRL